MTMQINGTPKKCNPNTTQITQPMSINMIIPYKLKLINIRNGYCVEIMIY